MTENLEDYVEAYKKHELIKRNLIAENLKFEKEDKILEHIIQNALLKFSIKREAFLRLVNE